MFIIARIGARQRWWNDEGEMDYLENSDQIIESLEFSAMDGFFNYRIDSWSLKEADIIQKFEEGDVINGYTIESINSRSSIMMTDSSGYTAEMSLSTFLEAYMKNGVVKKDDVTFLSVGRKLMRNNFNNADPDVVDKMFAVNKVNKKGISSFLELNEDGRRVIDFTSEPCEQDLEDEERELIRSIRSYHYSNFNQTVEVDLFNKTIEIDGQVNKLGKYLIKHKERLIEGHSTTLYRFLHLKLSRHLSSIYNEVYDETNDHTKAVKISVRKLFDKMLTVLGSSVKNVRICISTNPLDMLTASMNCSYSSCYRIGGEYFGGTLSHLCDSSTAIMFSMRDGEEIGDIILHKSSRRFLTIGENAFMLGNNYNPFPETWCKVIREDMYRLYGIGNAWTIRRDQMPSTFFTDEFSGYKDESGAILVYFKEKTSPEDVQFYSHPGYCVECGGLLDSHGDDVTGSCCEGIECYECGERFNEGQLMFRNDEHYCEDCFDDIFIYCENCDDVVTREESYSNQDGERFCEDCYNEKFSACDVCGDHEENCNLTETEDSNRVCEICMQEHYFYCDVCEKYHDNEDYDEGYDLCIRCADDKREEERDDEDAA